MVKRGVTLYLEDELIKLAQSKNLNISALINQFLRIELLNEFGKNQDVYIESLKHTASKLATELDQKTKELEQAKKELQEFKENSEKKKKSRYIDLGRVI